MNLDGGIVDRSDAPAGDETWANRAVVYCADVLNYCFGESGPSQTQWNELWRCGEVWQAALPSSFLPMYEAQRVPPAAFPDIWYRRHCHGKRFEPKSHHAHVLTGLTKLLGCNITSWLRSSLRHRILALRASAPREG